MQTFSSYRWLPELDPRISRLKEKKSTLIAYMNEKICEEDWHGVADAAMDLREIEVELRILKS